jgi:pyruvate/2-oxoglutarate dehydrogenase complex dihydrolipoamide acyltransferase (E2) component
VPISIVVPQLGESVVEGTISKWLKNVGDPVKEEEPLVEIMTDKITIEVPSPGSGTLGKILVDSGTVPIGEKIAILLKEGESLSDADSAPKSAAETTAAAKYGASGTAGGTTAAQAPPTPASISGAAAAAAAALAGTGAGPATRQAPAAPPPAAPRPAATSSAPAPAAPQGPGGNGHARYSPVVRRLSREHEVDPAWVKGSGLGGRVTRDDMLAYIADLKAGKVAPPQAGAPAGRAGAVGLPATGPMEETVAIAGIRKAIAENMVKSKFTAVHTTTFEEVDMSAIVRLRQEWKEKLARDGVKLTFTPFFVKAAVVALREFPTMNATWNGEESVTIKRTYNIGIAVGRDKGLIVPVLKDAGSKPLVEVARGVEDLATRAHADKLTLDDLTGGTFTITNAGLFGSFASTPIISYPEVAILGVHKITDQPMAVDGQVVVRPKMNLALTFDHRWIDGHTAVQFVVRVKDLLEKPGLLWFAV